MRRPNLTIDEVLPVAGSAGNIEEAAETGKVKCTAVHERQRLELDPDFWIDHRLERYNGAWCAVPRNWGPLPSFDSDAPDSDAPTSLADLSIFSSGVTFVEAEGRLVRFEEPEWQDVMIRSKNLPTVWRERLARSASAKAPKRYEGWAREIRGAPKGGEQEVAQQIARRENVDIATVKREVRRVRQHRAAEAGKTDPKSPTKPPRP